MPEDPDVEELTTATPGSSGPQGAAGGMGVSSERTGPIGPGGAEATDGGRDTSPVPTTDDAPPEATPGGTEDNPEGIAPKAGYPDRDPRS